MLSKQKNYKECNNKFKIQNTTNYFKRQIKAGRVCRQTSPGTQITARIENHLSFRPECWMQGMRKESPILLRGHVRS